MDMLTVLVLSAVAVWLACTAVSLWWKDRQKTKRLLRILDGDDK